MSQLDFTQPAQAPINESPIYDPAVALEFFKSAGKPESVAERTILFAEDEKASRILLKRDKMYLLLDGEGGRLLHSLDDALQFFVLPTGDETGAVLLAGRWTLQEIGASEPIGAAMTPEPR